MEQNSSDASGSAVDAVFTWVDGSDSRWLESKRLLQQKLFEHKGAPDDADNAARFRDNDELRYALRSLAIYAPWIRKVHLVTADQKPVWLNTKNVNLVSHKAIFPEDVPLPVFSTRPIEFCIHRIPGLAERFLYFNDDFLLGRSLSPDEFFLPDGRPILWVCKRSPQYMSKLMAKLGSPSSHASAVARAHKLIRDRYGEEFFYVMRHYPKAMTRSSAFALWDVFPQEIRATLHAPFRSPTDVSVTMLYPLFMLAERSAPAKIVNGIAQIRDFLAAKGVAHLGASVGDSNFDKKLRAIKFLRPRTFCLNDAPAASSAEREKLAQFLRTLFPQPCKYELPE